MIGRSSEEREPVAHRLVAGYYLDESAPDIPVLRRRDGTFVAAFSAQGASREGIVRAARAGYLEGGLFRRRPE